MGAVGGGSTTGSQNSGSGNGNAGAYAAAIRSCTKSSTRFIGDPSEKLVVTFKLKVLPSGEIDQGIDQPTKESGNESYDNAVRGALKSCIRRHKLQAGDDANLSVTVRSYELK